MNMNMYHQIVQEDAENIVKEPLLWDKLRNTTVLVTGASGFIGSYLVCTMLALNDMHRLNIKVLALVRSISRAESRFSNVLGRADLVLVEHNIYNAFEYAEPIDFIIHGAGTYAKKVLDETPVDVLATNIIGTHNMLEFAVQKSVQRFIYLSSSRVYSEISFFCNNKLVPSEYYSGAKQSCELLCLAFAQQYSLSCAALRLFGIYGPGIILEDSTATTAFIKQKLAQKPIKLDSSGKQISSRCYVADAASAIFYVLLSDDINPAYDVSADEITILEWASLINELSEPVAPIKVNIESQDAGYTTEKPDLSGLSKLGWQARTSPKEGLRRLWQTLVETGKHCS